MLRLLSFSLIIIFFSCDNSGDKRTFDNHSNWKIFDRQQVNQIKQIRDFYIERRCLGANDVCTCIKNFMLSKRENPNSDLECLDIDATSSIISSLDNELKKKIWLEGKGYRTVSYRPILRERYKYFTFNLNGEYFDYLKTQSNIENVNVYVDQMTQSEGIPQSPNAFFYFVMNYDQFDWCDPDFLIIEAIHQLSIESAYLDFYNNKMHLYKIVKKELD